MVDPVTASLLVLNGGLVLGNGLLYITNPKKTEEAILEIKHKALQKPRRPKTRSHEAMPRINRTETNSLIQRRSNPEPTPRLQTQAIQAAKPENRESEALEKFQELNSQVSKLNTKVNLVDEHLSTEIQAVKHDLNTVKNDYYLFKDDVKRLRLPQALERIGRMEVNAFELKHKQELSKHYQSEKENRERVQSVLDNVKKITQRDYPVTINPENDNTSRPETEKPQLIQLSNSLDNPYKEGVTTKTTPKPNENTKTPTKSKPGKKTASTATQTETIDLSELEKSIEDLKNSI